MSEHRIAIHTTLKASAYKRLREQARLENLSMGQYLDELIEREGYYLNTSIQRILENQQKNIIEIIHRIII